MRAAVGQGSQDKAAVVAQALVMTLAGHGGLSLSGKSPQAPLNLDSPICKNSLLLANALAACVISMRLGANYRQWAAQMLVSLIQFILFRYYKNKYFRYDSLQHAH